MRILYMIAVFALGIVSVPTISNAQDLFLRQDSGSSSSSSGGNSIYLPRNSKAYTPSPGSKKENVKSVNKVFMPTPSNPGITRGGTSSRNNLDEVQRINIAHAQAQAQKNSEIVAARSASRRAERAKIDAQIEADYEKEQAMKEANGGELPPEFRTDAASIQISDDQKIYVKKPQGDTNLNKPARLFNVFE